MMERSTYFQSHRAPTLWFVTLISVAMSVFGAVLTLGMTLEKDLYDYSSITSMRMWQAFFLLVSNVLTLTVSWLSGKYVLKISINSAGELEIRTWSMFLITRTFRLRQEDIAPQAMQHYEGRTVIPGKPIVHAPWDSIRTHEGRRFVVDLQGSFPHGYGHYYGIIRGGKK